MNPMNLVGRAAESILGRKEDISTGSTQPDTDPTGKTMHALTWEGKYNIGYTVKPRPALTHPKDAVIKVTATTICGSDLHLYAGEVADMHKGDILGHEFMGIVQEVGDQVTNLRPGQRVVVTFNIADGTCSYCKRGEWTGCDSTNDSKLMEKMYGHRLPGIFGYSHLLGGYPGGQAEYVRVPFADVNCFEVPADLPDEKALFLSDVVCTSFHAVDMAEVNEGDTVAIWGLGPIGLLAARWCQLRKAKTIIGIDNVSERLELARNSLGINVINFENADVLEAIKELVPGGVDCAIDAAGFRYAKSFARKLERAIGLESDTSETLSECITALRKFGKLSIIADYLGYTNHFPIGALMEKHLTVRGGQCPVQKYIGYCMDQMRSGAFDPTFIVTHRLSLADGPKVYDKFFKKEDGIIKVILTLPGNCC